MGKYVTQYESLGDPIGKFGRPKVVIFRCSDQPAFLDEKNEKKINAFEQRTIFTNYIIVMSKLMWKNYDKTFRKMLWEHGVAFTIFDFAERQGFKLNDEMKRARDKAAGEIIAVYDPVFAEIAAKRKKQRDLKNAMIDDDYDWLDEVNADDYNNDDYSYDVE